VPAYDRAVRWRPCLSLAIASLLCGGIVLSAQSWPAIPPIPVQERFRPRSVLSLRLRPRVNEIPAGDLPAFTLVMRNVGTKTILVPPGVSTNNNVRLRVFDAAGRERRSALSCSYQRIVTLLSVRSHLRIAPGQSRIFPLDQPCGGLPSLPAGDYQFEASYLNYPDAPGAYDVYEAGASEAWEGSSTTPRVPIKVLPLDPATERALIARVDGTGSLDDVGEAIRRLGLGGSAAATPALIRRFERDHSRRLDIARALVQGPDPAAAAALAEAVERLSPAERSLFFLGATPPESDGWLPIVRRAPGCSALPLVLNLYGQREEAVRILEERCTVLRTELLKASQSPSPATPRPEAIQLTERAVRAAALLQLLDRPPVGQAAAQSEDDFPEDVRPDPAAVADYLRAVMGDDQGDLELAVKGLARFGTVDDFLRVKNTFATREENSRGALEYPLVRLSFVSDRDAAMTNDPAFWDAWWKTHALRTRVQWAREALQRGMLRTKWVTHDQAPSRAAEFLLATQGLSPALVRELAQHPSYLVRLALADAVSEADEQSGGRLYMRELSNRYVGACIAANERLERLTRTRLSRYQLDCADPAQRRQAIAYWTKVVDRMELGFLPLTVARLAQ
jgi:hypothetical protein